MVKPRTQTGVDREGRRAFAKSVKLREGAEGEFAAFAGREERKGQGERSAGFRAKTVATRLTWHSQYTFRTCPFRRFYRFRRTSQTFAESVFAASRDFATTRLRRFSQGSSQEIRSSRFRKGSQFAVFAVRKVRSSQVSQFAVRRFRRFRRS